MHEGELRNALRRLARSPGFSVAAIATLALGIGASAAIVAVIWGVIIKPLPFPDADRLVVIEHRLPGYPAENGEVTFGAFQGQLLQYAEDSEELVEVGAYGTFDAPITEPDSPEHARLGYASAGFFRALGVEPVNGRLFDDDEPEAAGAGRGSSLLSFGVATQRYGSPDAAVGRIIRAEGFEHEIVGVLPAGLSFPPEPVQLWNPRTERALRANLEWTVDALVGRMAPEATVQSVQRELTGLVTRIPQRFPGTAIESVAEAGRMAPRVTPMKDWLIGDVRAALWLLLASVAVVMAMVWVNVANLLVVRTDARARELTTRSALGATRGRLARHFFGESAVLCAVSGILASAIGVGGVRALTTFGAADLPRVHEVAAGWEVVAPVLVLTALGMAFLTVVPLLAHARRHRHASPMGGTALTASRVQLRARHLMVGLQIAMAAVLLVGSGLVLRSFHALSSVDPGFEAEGLLTFRVPFPYREIQEGGAAGGRSTPFFDQLADTLVTLPGVTSAGYGSCIPLAQSCALDGYPVKPEGAVDVEVAEQPLAGLQPISPGFIESLGIPLLSGRALERSDHLNRTNAVLVSAGLAERLWPGEEPLGKRLEQGGGSAAQNFHFTVVGVVADVRFDHLRDDPEYIVYTPVLFQERNRELWSTSFVVRVAGDPLNLVDEVRARAARIRPDIPLADIDSMRGVVARSTAGIRLAMRLLAAAAAAALGLSAIGVYGVIANVVSLRRHELGIRLALGAEQRQLRTLVLRQGTTTLLVGLAAGLAGAAAAGRFLAAVLFMVEPTDPVTYAAVAVFLAATALAAALFPAQRATRVSPAEALRR